MTLTPTPSLVLADSADATSGQQVGPRAELQCAQTQPAETTTAYSTIPWTRYDVEPAQLACAPSCSVNLVMSAWGKRRGRQQPGDRRRSHGPVKQDKGRINIVHFPDGARRTGPLETTTAFGRLRDAPDAGDVERTPSQEVVYSVRIDNPRDGDRFMVEARVVTKISALDYNVELPTQVLVAKQSPIADGAGVAVYTDPSSDVSEFNGVNCTQRPSAHELRASATSSASSRSPVIETSSTSTYPVGARRR